MDEESQTQSPTDETPRPAQEGFESRRRRFSFRESPSQRRPPPLSLPSVKVQEYSESTTPVDETVRVDLDEYDMEVPSSSSSFRSFLSMDSDSDSLPSEDESDEDDEDEAQSVAHETLQHDLNESLKTMHRLERKLDMYLRNIQEAETQRDGLVREKTQLTVGLKKTTGSLSSNE